jgi:uncharacterized protein YndB with AHSA1/START domain
MDARGETVTTPAKNVTTVRRKSERELVVTRTFNGPARIVFDAFTKPELFKRWWVPKSLPLKLLSCEQDVRVGGTYKLVFATGDSEMAFFGTYTEVIANERLVWTNDEGGAANQSITTVTFEEKNGKTLLVLTELHPSKEALEEALNGSSEESMVNEIHRQLDELLVSLGCS